jgi:uncharacterized protein (DUF2147 family)
MNMHTSNVLYAIVLFLASLPTLAADSGSTSVAGRWRNEAGNAVIEVRYAEDGTLEGVGAPGGSDPDRKDEKNPEPQLRERKLLGAPILWGFRPDNEERTEWSGGKIYDPDNGETYDCKVRLDGDNLRIRGYVGIPLFGRTTVWKRD